MQKFTLLLLFCLSLLSCTDDSDLENNQVSTQETLAKVMVGDKNYQVFEYSDNQNLIKESEFTNECDVPTSTFTYTYNDNKAASITILTRELYSSTITMCDPNSGITSAVTLEYNSQGRLIKTSYPSSYTSFEYNSLGQITKETSFNSEGINYRSISYEYDGSGNLIKEIDQAGKQTEYSYDNKINPYHLMKQRPHWISPFNTSPNNVIKATGEVNFTRSFKYDTFDLPIEVLETNGLTYTFHYSKHTFYYYSTSTYRSLGY